MSDPVITVDEDRVYVQWGPRGVVYVLDREGLLTEQLCPGTGMAFVDARDVGEAEDAAYEAGRCGGYDAAMAEIKAKKTAQPKRRAAGIEVTA